MKIKLRYFDWSNMVLDTELPSNSKYLCLYLAGFMNKDQNVAWPSLQRIVKETGLSKSTACKYIDVLESEGWIERDRGGPKSNTRYRITFPDHITVMVDGSAGDGLGSAGDGLGSAGDGLGSAGDGLGVVRDTDTNSPLNNPINKKDNSDKSASDSSRMPACPHDEIVSMYHEMIPEWKAIKKWDARRRRKLESRWKEESKRQTLDWWKRYFEFIRLSPFLMGQVTSGGRRPFKRNLEWLVESKNMIEIIESKYHDD